MTPQVGTTPPAPPPAVLPECEEPDFVEGHEDPAQSEELERQQDA
ncbi:hypothetical protein [Rhodoferax sp. U2-2l]|nr:hypothetical protein [Rhodoferax sp. U2-2l]